MRTIINSKQKNAKLSEASSKNTINIKKRRTIFTFTPLIIFIAIVAIFATRLGKDASAIPSPLIDKKIPSFELTKLANYKLLTWRELSSEKVVVLNIFASWCVPCKIEHKYITKISKIVPTYGIAWRDKPNDTIKWLNQMGNAYARIGSDIKGRAGINIGVYGVPETYIIENGIIRYRHVGAIDKKILENEIIPLLNRIKAN